MVNIMSVNGTSQYDVYEFVCDTPDDLKQLPKGCGAGSIALIISTGSVYVLNGSREWVEI